MPTFACIRCSERKVRCDKQSPCGTCAKHDVQCIFRPPRSSRSRQKLVKDDLVYERLKRLEGLLQEKGIDPNQAIGGSGSEHSFENNHSEVTDTAWQLSTPASVVPAPQTTFFKPRVLHGSGGTKFVDNSLWSRVAEEIHDAEVALEEDSADDASDVGAPNDDFGYVLGWNSPVPASPHPSAELIHQLWQTFIKNVDPLTKVVHVPTLQLAIERAIANIEQVPRGFEALMFAMYSMAVLSLREEECQETIGETRTILLSRYIDATKGALLRAKFMSSTSIVVLQALFLHILSIRSAYEPRAVWNLTGLAIRMAEVMGMRVDGTLIGLSPFETEIHRRIWWQLKMHDFRAAELSGQGKFRDFNVSETTPRKPTNINDSDIYPAMLQAPTESTKPTEMIWIMLRTELANFAATMKAKMQTQGRDVVSSEEFIAMDDLKIKDGFMEKIEDLLETKYLRFCDPSQPIHLLAMVGARCALNLIRFLSHHPRRWGSLDKVPVSEEQFVWNVVVQLLEQYDMMQTNPQLQPFAWNVPYFIQWHAVIHVLDTLRANPFHLDDVKAWRLIDALYHTNSEMLLSINRPIFVAVGNLCLKAYNARVAAMKNEKRSLPDPPEYITKLRERQEAAKARREAAITKSKGSENLDSEKRPTTTDTFATRPVISLRQVEAQSQPVPIVEQLNNPITKGIRTGDDAFWLSDALEDGLFTGGAVDMMELDIDAILAQDYSFDTPNGQEVDWAQWDVWLGNVDPIRPNVGLGQGGSLPKR